MTLVLTLLVFLLVLSFLVLIHEAGHFVAARMFGVVVYEFGFGYPPRMMGLFVKWGTEFTLNYLPFGGFVRLAGEEREEVQEGEKENLVKSDDMFCAKSAWQRVVIIVAGAAVNFVFGVLAFGTIFTWLGIPQEQGVVIMGVDEGTPADEAGVEMEDRIVAVVVEGERQEVVTTNGFVELVGGMEGERVGLVLNRKGEEMEVEVYARKSEDIPDGQGAMGVEVSSGVEFVKYPLWEMPFRGAWYGIKTAVAFGWMILQTVGVMVGDLVAGGKVPDDLSGPIGIVYAAKKENILQEGWLGIVNFAAILSINLAIVNVLPFPALDGGRVLFVFLEKMLGKKFKPVYERYANMAGFGLLILVVVLVSLRDVQTILVDLEIFK